MVEVELHTFMNLIENHAWVALKKIKKPTIYEHQDLVNEGVAIFYEAKKTYKEGKNTTFRTFFITLLRNHFCDIVKRSFMKSRTFTDEAQEESYKEYLRRKLRMRTPLEKSHTSFLFSKLKQSEKKYIISLLLSNCCSLRKRREEVRRNLHLSLEEEERTRLSILSKIQKS